MNNSREMIESMLKGWIEESIVDPRTILTAFHNVCVHGETLVVSGLNVEDKTLTLFFEGMDMADKALSDME